MSNRHGGSHSHNSNGTGTGTSTNRIHEEIVDEFVDDLIFELSADIHWALRTKNYSLAHVLNVPPKYCVDDWAPSSTGSTREEPVSTGKGGHLITQCPVCHEAVGATRFAPHLEKCMRGGKRGAKRANDGGLSGNDGFMSLPYYKPKPPPAIIEDPHPRSTIIRIKLHRGVPVNRQKRMGATLAEFEDAVAAQARLRDEQSESTEPAAKSHKRSHKKQPIQMRQKLNL